MVDYVRLEQAHTLPTFSHTPAHTRYIMPIKLTARSVEASKPRDKRYEISDSEQPGLRLLIQPSGFKSWVYRYERADRKTEKITIGPASGPGLVSLADARNTANDFRRLRSSGADPAVHTRNQRKALAEQIEIDKREARRKDSTVENVLPRYFADHVNALKSSAEVKRVLNRELSTWAKLRVEDIKRKDAISLLDAKKITAPIQAKRLRAYAKHFFAWCQEKELISSNPFDGTRAAKEQARERVLTDGELLLLLRALERLEWPRRQLIHLLLLTAQRLDEVGAMTWSELDLDAASPVWVIPGARVKNGTSHNVPLAPTAAQILIDLRNGQRQDATARVFASFSEAHAKRSIDKALLGIAKDDAMAIGNDPDEVSVAPWRFHDLRRTAATTMPRLGVDVTVVERVLNHTMRGVMAVYQRYTFDREKRAALEAWSDFLRDLRLSAISRDT